MSLKIWVAPFASFYVTKELNSPSAGNITFRSRLNGCTGTVTNAPCDITINYNWEADPDAGSGTAFISSGTSSVTVTPSTSFSLTLVTITSVSWTLGSCSGYSSTVTPCN